MTAEMNEGEAAPAVSPVRIGGHICVCVIVRGRTDKGAPLCDSCPQWVDNPDQPFCDACHYEEHEKQADPYEVAKKIEMMMRGREPA